MLEQRKSQRKAVLDRLAQTQIQNANERDFFFCYRKKGVITDELIDFIKQCDGPTLLPKPKKR